MTTMVLDVAEWSRFEIHVDGQLAGWAAYRYEPGRITFTHTEIDPMYSGHGFGGELVREALDTARRRNLLVVPDCPFVRSFIAKHDEYADLVASRPPR
jgi:uncharacterized protein